MNNSEAVVRKVLALAVEKQFFALIDKANRNDFRPQAPTLAALMKLLQRYDRLCEFLPSTDFATAIDVRLFYVAFTVLKSENPNKRCELMTAGDDETLRAPAGAAAGIWRERCLNHVSLSHSPTLSH